MAPTRKRKRRTGGSARFTQLIPIRVDEGLYERIQIAADAEQLSLSAYCRRLLQNLVPAKGTGVGG